MEIEKILEIVKNKYGENDKRFKHILGVYKLASKLAVERNVDLYKAQAAALIHDFYKNESVEEMKAVINDEKIVKKFKKAPSLYHAYASAASLEPVFGITDKEIYDAVAHHVYGALNMSVLEEIIVLADFCEENRTYKACVEVRNILLDGDFYKAMYLCLDYTIQFLRQKGLEPMNDQVKICEYYRKKGGYWFWNY